MGLKTAGNRFRRGAVAAATAMVLALPMAGAAGADVGLFEWAFNIDSVVADSLLGDPLPVGVIGLPFYFTTGLGTLEVTISSAGSHKVLAFFDHEIDELLNTYYNEFGTANNVAAAGQSWEIDEPGYVSGNIYDNFVAGALENTSGVLPGTSDDVSMAMGWGFLLAAGEQATLKFIVGETAPTVGFYLAQTDPDSSKSIYLSSELRIVKTGNEQIPEPASLALLGLGLAAMAGMRRAKASA